MELTVTNVTVALVGALFSIGCAYGIVKTKMNGIAKDLKKKKDDGECKIQIEHIDKTFEENKTSHTNFYTALGDNAKILTELTTKQNMVLEIVRDMQNNKRKRNGD